MSLTPSELVHPDHQLIFIRAAQSNHCHILVRKTGRASIAWIGRRGYTGKRGDLKAKTADRDLQRYQLAGLVCSPYLHPGAFTQERRPFEKVMEAWQESAHLITVPNDGTGFDDTRQALGCATPYLLQTNRRHRHYGCVALVDMGLLAPRYVHGDYDIYAIIPAGRPFDPRAVAPRASTMGSTMAPSSMPLQKRLALEVQNREGPLSFRIATQVNTRIAATSPDLLGSLMVNHGEQVCIGPDGWTGEPVLAFLAEPRNGRSTQILQTPADHRAFYRSA